MDDWYDEWAGIDWGSTPSVDTSFDLGGLDLSGISLDTPYFDLGDMGTLLNGIDLSGIDFSGLDLSGISLNNLYQDLGDTGTLLGGIDGDIYGGADLSGISLDTPYQDLGDTGTFLGGGEGGVTQPNESQFSTTKQNADGTTTQTFDDGSTITIRKDPITGQEEVVDYTTATDVPPSGGEVVPSGTGRGSPAPTGGTTNGTTGGATGGTTAGGKTGIEKLLESGKNLLSGAANKDNAMLMALLGGLMGLLSKGSAPKGPVGYQGGIPKYTATRVPGRGVEYTRAAQGGLMGLAAGGAARPARYLRGGTDGMADKIQTDIEGKQPARLSHGEFVIPADVVSHLGNGNSDAGADVLYEMMAKVRKARTGTPKQGKQINPRKMIPA